MFFKTDLVIVIYETFTRKEKYDNCTVMFQNNINDTASNLHQTSKLLNYNDDKKIDRQIESLR